MGEMMAHLTQGWAKEGVSARSRRCESRTTTTTGPPPPPPPPPANTLTFSAPISKPIDDATIEQGRAGRGTVVKIPRRRVHGEHHVQIALDVFGKMTKQFLFGVVHDIVVTGGVGGKASSVRGESWW